MKLLDTHTISNIVHLNLKNTNGMMVQHCLPKPLSYPSNRNSEEVYHYINQQLSTVMMIPNDNLVMVGVKFYCFSLDMTLRLIVLEKNKTKLSFASTRYERYSHIQITCCLTCQNINTE